MAGPGEIIYLVSVIVLMLLEFIVYGPLSVVLLYGVITSNPKYIQSWMG